MSWKVLVTSFGFVRSGEKAKALLEKSGCEVVFSPRPGPFKSEDLIPLLKDTDAIVASLDQFDSSALNSTNAARLKIIARWGAGFDSVDLGSATKRGIVVTYTPGLLDDAVADYTMALLLALARRVVEGHNAMCNEMWKPLWGAEAAGKTLGIIGCGRIGMAVARRALGFNMRLLAYNPRPNPRAEELGVKFVSLDTLLGQSDFVSLHAALNSSNFGMIGAEQLNRMKREAFLINTARGSLVDESALAAALIEGRIAGAALDVFGAEPMSKENPLRNVPNVILSPHQASFSRDTGERVSLCAAQSILDLLAGGRPVHVVNPEVYGSKF